MLRGKWLSNSEISDPYRRSNEVFELVNHKLNNSTKLWADKLK
ncbi:hypothetical protein EDC52_101561 [Biostraticola tofi]|uniref:Protein-tyrosine-phosphatase n=1 Tax=Biostraticola tofi TaxID=466109 RepID=A0A4R3Z4U7_9GAMM|nr:hypothetical protein EDC52_101561 [Biostraticola tofi]